MMEGVNSSMLDLIYCKNFCKCHPAQQWKEKMMLLITRAQIFYFFIRFIYEYFILFHIIINGTVFFISFLCYSLLMLRNTIDFGISILYPTTLVNLLKNTNNLFVDSIGFLVYKIHIFCD
jgi:hypothetical protein